MTEFAQKERPPQSCSKNCSAVNRQKKLLPSRSLGHFSEKQSLHSKAENALGSSGRLNDSHASSLSDAHFGHDFSQVKVHSSLRAMPPASPLAIGPIQAKLAVSQPWDEYEREADRVAEQVVQMPRVGEISARPVYPIQIQALRFKPNKILHPQELPNIEADLNANKATGQPLPKPVRTFFGTLMDYDFSQVKIYADAKAARLSRNLNARAFTTGHDIYFSAGRYQPETNQGKRLLVHELTHVVQQSGRSSILQRDLDQETLRNRARRIFDAVQIITGTDEGAIIEALRGLNQNDAQALIDIYEQLYSSQRAGRSLPDDLVYELENPVHRYRALNLLHYGIHHQGEPPLGIRRPYITANPEIQEVVPGSQVTYTIEAPERLGAAYHYQWLVRNDPRTVEQRHSTISGRNTPYFLEGPTDTASWEVIWDFPGRHTIVCELHVGLDIEGYYEYIQIVREPRELAEESLEQQEEAMRPDRYISRLEMQLANLRRGNAGQNAERIRQLEETVERARLLLEVPGEFELETRTGETGASVVHAGGPGPSRPMRAILLPTARPEPISLRLYTKPLEGGRWAIMDLTDPLGNRIGPYEGAPTSGSQGNEAIRSAVQAAWDIFIRDNQHPAGQIVGEPPVALGFPEGTRWNDHSDGISSMQQVSQWFSRVGFVAGLGALALASGVVPGGQPVAVALLLVISSAAGATATTLEMLDRAEYGDIQWNTETALNLLDLAGNLAVGTGSAVRLSSRALRIVGLSSAYFIPVAEGIDTGSDIASGVIVTGLNYSRIQQIENSNLSLPEKREQIRNILAAESLQSTFTLLGIAPGGRRGQRGADILEGRNEGIFETEGGHFESYIGPDETGRIVFDNIDIRRTPGTSSAREVPAEWYNRLLQAADAAHSAGQSSFLVRSDEVISVREINRLRNIYLRMGSPGSSDLGELRIQYRGFDEEVLNQQDVDRWLEQWRNPDFRLQESQVEEQERFLSRIYHLSMEFSVGVNNPFLETIQRYRR